MIIVLRTVKEYDSYHANKPEEIQYRDNEELRCGTSWPPKTDIDNEIIGTPHTQKNSRGSLMSSAVSILKARERMSLARFELASQGAIT